MSKEQLDKFIDDNLNIIADNSIQLSRQEIDEIINKYSNERDYE